MWKKAVLACFDILSGQRKLRETSARTGGVLAVIRTGHVSITSHNGYRMK
jgi:hypothetical protein